MKEIYLNFNVAIDNQAAQLLFKIIPDILSQDFKRINFLISSPGGNVDSGIAIYNFLKGLPVEVYTHNYGSCDSIAALIFCAGKKRLTVSNSRFLIHGIGVTIEKERFDENKLKELLGSLKNQRETISKIIATECQKELKDVEKDLLEGKIMDPEEAIEYGLATEIKDRLVPQNAKLINIGQ